MPDEVSVIGLDELVATLERIPARALPMADAVVFKGARNIQEEARELISGHPHAPAYPASITYDLTHGFGTVDAEIGPDKDRPQGPLGNILEYGTDNNAPLPHLHPAADHEEPRFEAAVADMAIAMWDRG